ncbi:rab family small GTPase [Naegleria gruberi]|uniref:Rab family small GTPase n=1 Tax=Naegleria gruberi TaxID=5762 RepID=D2V2Z3_NAEGR|nr:rab family small GTPase [Naegleria gruberi]EFC48692.1 rab family small GTPase [Naegleria gruberi]|eukprot:XP_002681436.1 rab family small GTPase [Naegleria gruberi strain NEG-M]
MSSSGNVEEEIRYSYKLIVIGDSGVGKSSLIVRAAHNKFNLNTKPTIGVDFASKEIQIKGNTVHAQIWDTAGQEKYQAVMPAMYRGAQGCMVVFDITNKESFDNAGKWANQLIKYGDQECKKVLVGNKCDLNHLRQVSIEEATEYAKSIGSAYMETSALNAHNVELAFNTIMNEIHSKTPPKNIVNPPDIVPPQPRPIDITKPPVTPGNQWSICNC